MSQAEPASSSRREWIASPYLHYTADGVYNPITDARIGTGEPAFARFRAAADDGTFDETLVRDGWIIPAGEDLSHRFRLKIVSLETVTTCNQKCYFCPVSVAPREDEEMPTETFERIVSELIQYRGTIDGVFLQSYNEPTIDRRFVDHCRTLFNAGLPVAVLSNGSGLTPAKVDALLEAGRLRFLCINLSTLDRDRYRHDRGEDHLGVVLRNLDYLRDKPLAADMRIVVLGEMDEVHRTNYQAIRDRFAGSRFAVDMHQATDRAGWLEVGMKLVEPKKHLAGCELMGSRPIQHLHITPGGECVLCCQDYDENYVVGNLQTSSIHEVLAGDEMAKMRRWVYGVEEAPADFICRTCVFALER